MVERAPLACTLQQGALDERLRWIEKLRGRALLRAERRGLELRMLFLPSAAKDVARLVDLERDCCAFLSFERQSYPGAEVLTIRAPEAARFAADRLLSAIDGDRAA